MPQLYKDSGFVADVSEMQGIVVLYASAFNNQDAHGDIIAPGAFAKTIRERGPQGSNRIKHLWMHWWDDMIGRPLELAEDEKGLRVVSKLSDTTLGRDALILYKDGVITEHSIGLDVMERDDEDTRVIKEIRLWEYSSVTWGANSQTPTVETKGSGRGANAEILTPLPTQIENARRALATGVSDGLCKTIEAWIDQATGRTHPEDAPHQQLADQVGQLALLSRIRALNTGLNRA